MANAAFKIVDFFMNTFYVPLKMNIVRKLFSTNVALKICNFVVNNFNVFLVVF